MHKFRSSQSPPRPSAIRSIAGLLQHSISRTPSPDLAQSSSDGLHGNPVGTLHGSRSDEPHRDSYGGSLYHELRTRWEKPVATVVRFSGSEMESGHPEMSGFSGALGNSGIGTRIKEEESTRTRTMGGMSGGKVGERWGGSRGLIRKHSESEADFSGQGLHGDEDETNSSLPGSAHAEETGLLSDDAPRKRKCLVCEDAASGYHYGVSSCEACKAFFKRTIQGNIEYACPASNTCIIDKRRRKACQACRYKKCLDVGMLKEGVRLDRVRGGRQKYKRASTGDPIIVQTSSSHSASKKSSTSHELHQLVTSLLACEPDSLLANITDRLDTCLKIQIILCELADRDLVGIIGWAKQIPGFSDLPLNDQMHLLQTTWCEILLFSLCFRSMEAHPHMLLFTEDFSVTDQMARDAGFGEVHSKACRLIEDLVDFRICREEYVLIKCIILLNGGCLLESVAARNALRDNIVQSLHQFANGSARASTLLLLLPHLRTLDGLAKQYWFVIKNEGKITMHKLFLEMLESAHQLI